MQFVNVVVEASRLRGAALPHRSNWKGAEQELVDLHRGVWRARYGDKDSLSAFELDLAEAMALIVGVGDYCSHVCSLVRLPRDA